MLSCFAVWLHVLNVLSQPLLPKLIAIARLRQLPVMTSETHSAGEPGFPDTTSSYKYAINI